MSYWAAVQVQPSRDKVALHFLGLHGFACYAPRLRDPRVVRGAKVIQSPLFFPGYCFIAIELQWSPAQFCPGVVRVVMDGITPARVPDRLIATLKAREVSGLIELPPPPPRFRKGDHVQVRRGPLAGRVGLFVGMRPRERVALLLNMMGSSRRVELADRDVERWA